MAKANDMAITINAPLLTLVNNAADVTTAVAVLRANYIFDPTEIATYLAASRFGGATDNTNGNGSNNGGNGTSFQTLLGIPTAVGGISQMGNFINGPSAATMNLNNATAAVKAAQANVIRYSRDAIDSVNDFAITNGDGTITYGKTLDSALLNQLDAEGAASTAAAKQSPLLRFIRGAKFKKGATTAAAALANKKLFEETQKTVEKAELEKGLASAAAKNFAFYGLAFFATMLWLQEMWPTLFSIHPYLAPHLFIRALATAAAITASVVAAAVISVARGSLGAPATPTGAAVQSFVSQIPPWYRTLPSTGVALMTGGLLISSTAYSITPGHGVLMFREPTIAVAPGLSAATGAADGASMLGRVLVQPGQNAGDPDTVLLTIPRADGNTDGLMFNLDANGYIVCENGKACDPTTYLPFFQPIVDASGKVTGVQKNYGALNALLQVPACMAVANDKSMDAKRREAALETCLRNNKAVQFIPGQQ